MENSGKNQDEILVAGTKYEYLPHPADIQLHSWGDTLEEATLSIEGMDT